MDYNFSSHIEYDLHDSKDYSHPNYYLRHPLNPRYQMDIFMRVGIYEREMILPNI